jgi:hypothetical protein
MLRIYWQYDSLDFSNRLGLRGINGLEGLSGGQGKVAYSCQGQMFLAILNAIMAIK